MVLSLIFFLQWGHFMGRVVKDYLTTELVHFLHELPLCMISARQPDGPGGSEEKSPLQIAPVRLQTGLDSSN